jgi:hypothetical protein
MSNILQPISKQLNKEEEKSLRYFLEDRTKSSMKAQQNAW